MAMNRQRRTSNISNIFSYDDAGNIVIKDYGQVTRYSWNGLIHGFVGPVSVSSVSAATTDTDRFLVSDGGVLKYRTGVELLSDIGGVPSTRTLTINGVTQDLSADRSWTIAAGISGTITTGQVAFGSGTNTIGGSSNLFWDNANGRLGIGTASPDYELVVTKPSSSSFKINTGVNSVDIISTTSFSPHFVNNFLFYYGAPGSGINKMTLFGATGNLVIQNGGTFTDGGQRLQVYGDAFVRGSGATSATSALLVQNSAGTQLFNIDNAGGSTLLGIFRVNNILGRTSDITIEGGTSGSRVRFKTFGNAGSYVWVNNPDGAFTSTTGDIQSLVLDQVFAPASGTSTMTYQRIQPTINQTGGANGITRGLYVNPTLTAAADWRSIEWSNNSGWGLYGAGTANNYLAGKLVIGTTTVSTFALDVNGTARVSGAVKLYSGGTAPFNNYPLNVYVSSGGFASFEYATTGFIQFVRAGASAGFIHSSYAENFDITLIPGNSFTTLGLCVRGEGQGVKIGGSTTITHVNSAQLNVESTTRGFLPPRMTTTQKNAIATPSAGLQVYDSTTNVPNYYDGTAWVAMGGGGGASIYTADGTLTSNRTVSSGGFSLVFNPQTAFVTTLTADTSTSTTALVSQNSLSYVSGFSSSNLGSVYGAVAGINLQTFAGSATFEQANLATAVASVNSIDFSASGATITMLQPVSSGIRAMTGHQSQIQYQGTYSGTVTHAAVSQNLGFYKPSAPTGTLTITNAYSLLLNDLDDYGGTGFVFTNRWGIYQDGASDNNYFKGKVVIGSTNTVGASPLNVKNLPTSATGLATGDIWNNGGVLNVV